MMRSVLSGLVCLLGASTAIAGLDPTFLPASTHYQGRNSFSVSEGGTLLQGHVEFAVYDTQEQTLTGYEGDGRYVYAYQVFSYNTSTAPITFFALLGANFSGYDLQSDDALGGETTAGVSPTGDRILEGGAKAVWDFGNGELVKTKNSWFLFFSSNSDWKPGSYDVQATSNDELPVPVPEPLTLALLAGGAILSLRRKAA